MRLPNGFGSVYKLSGNRRKPWVARKTTGWTFDEEKQKSYPIYAFVGYYESRKEALTALAEYNKDPYDLHHNTITFAEVFEKWSEVHFPKVSESNVKGYKASFRTCEKLHNMKFVEIKLDHLQQAVDESGKNTPTLKKMKIMFGLMYDYAVMHEIVTADKRDMVRYVDITKAGNPNAYNRKPFNKKQINMVWKVKDSNTYYSVILMLIYTGVRIAVNGKYIRGFGVPAYTTQSASTPAPSTTKKDITTIAKEVLAGQWGNGDDRKNRLTNAGYDYATVQAKVNELVSGKTSTPTKSVAEVAKEVLAGKWGNGTARKTALENAGYNYSEVQQKVNELCGQKSVTEVAKEVIQGKWGNGATRKSKLEQAGYNYSAVQAEVNRLLR